MTPHERLNTILSAMKASTKARNEKLAEGSRRGVVEIDQYECTLTFNDLVEQLHIQQFRCAQSGCIMTYTSGPYCISPHRPDAQSGSYVRGQFQFVCHMANLLIGDMTPAQYKQYSDEACKNAYRQHLAPTKTQLNQLSLEEQAFIRRKYEQMRFDKPTDVKYLNPVMSRYGNRSAYFWNSTAVAYK